MPSRKSVLLFVILSSLALYIAGVGTGWFIGQSYYHSAEEKLNNLEYQIKDLRTLSNSPDLCSYAEARYYMLLSSLSYFNLPYRLESADVPNDVLNRYMDVESEAFLTGQVLAKSCNIKPKLIVYFFKRKKASSLDAGKVLDRAKDDFVVLPFPVDTNSTSADSLVKYFNITRFPAVNICGKTITWPFNEENITGAERACK